MYSYKVLYFENDHERHSAHRKRTQSSRWRLRRHTPAYATRLLGEWGFNAGQNAGLYPDEVVLRGLYQDRELAKKGCWMLCINMVACQNVPGISIVDVDDTDAESWLTALHRRCNSALLGLQPEDWLDMADPVIFPAPVTSIKTGDVNFPQRLVDVCR